MSADFFRKKIVSFIAVLLSGMVFICVLFYAGILRNMRVIDVSKNFYFLTSSTSHVEVGIYDAQQQGGAGYYLEKEGTGYVALGVYLHEEEAKFVQNNLKEPTKCIVVPANKLYLKNNINKQRADEIRNAFGCLDGAIQVLNSEIARIDKGATQQSSKRVLSQLSGVLSYLEKQHAQSLPAFSSVYQWVIDFLKEKCLGIVYARDLRYALCFLCESYVQLSKEYSL